MKSLTILTIFFSSFSSYSQQTPIYDMFWNNYSLQNPAATGLFHKQYASVTGRLFWTGLSDTPKEGNAIYDYHSEKLHGGIGGNYQYEQEGFLKIQKLSLNYAYQFAVMSKGTLSIGASIGYYNTQFKPAWTTPDQNLNDPLLPQASSNSSVYINTGIMYKTPKLLLGLSMYQVAGFKIRKNDYYFKNTSMYATCSYTFDVTEKIALKPTVLLVTDFTNSYVALNLMTSYKKLFWAGLGLRTRSGYAVSAGIDFKQRYRIGYSFSGDLNNSFENWHSHEVVIALMLN